MTELWLKFTDEDGKDKRVLVEKEKFAVGRHSESDLCISNGKLSREHIKIERFADIFIVADCGSSNGTTLNGEPLEEPKALHNDDKLDLGGGFEITVEIVSDNPNAGGAPDSSGNDAGNANSAASASVSPAAGGGAANFTASNSSGSGSIPTSFFYLAPIFGFVVLLFLGGLMFVLSGDKKPEIAQKGDDFVYSGDADDNDSGKDENEAKNDSKNESKTEATPEPSIEKNVESNSESKNVPDASPAPKNVPDTVKIEQNAASFLRSIAQNDPKAFLTSQQAQTVNSKIKQIGASSALADNIKSAKANAAQIRSLAASKNLKPQFLAVAALTKLGNNRGNVFQTAQAMAEILDKLAIQLGSELADDSLLVMAAFDQGEAGDFLKMRNMLQQLSNQFPESSRTIRTIWFLREKGKISDQQFEFALRFLALGTITQNPKDFGVNAEELKLN
jgi:hypothetical protein